MNGQGKQTKLPASRLALAVGEAALSRQLTDFVRSHSNQPLVVGTCDELPAYLACDTDGLLLLAVASDAERVQVRQLIQDICLQRLPPTVVVLDARPDGSDLAGVDRYIARRLAWPADSAALVPLLRETGRGREFRVDRSESLEEVLSRRLLALTPSLLPLVDRIALAASHDVTVLLNGETGTGKTFLARLMHEYSPRREQRFLAVPCGALSANLVESEFFGHAKGAFTGADRPKIGKFAAVGAGTLLLDEIDTLATEQQATLLRVIETGEFEPVGSTETQKCLARLIVASNVDLEEAAERGKFRPDLYFRLNVMSFHLPPLRERLMDIDSLARGMAARFNRKFAKDLFDLHPECLAALEAYSWPGNLRQLENVVQHAVLVSGGPELLLRHLPPALQDQAKPSLGEPVFSGDTLQHQRDVIEKNVIARALASHGYSRTRTARALGISRVTLYKKMDKYGLLKESSGV